MKANEIKVGGYYRAKVSGVETTVRVDEIRESDNPTGSYADRRGRVLNQTVYHVTNLRTGRKTTFRSAAKFRSEVKEGGGFKMPGNGRKLKLDEEAPNPYIKTDAELEQEG